MASRRGKPDQDNAGSGTSSSENQIAEIEIFRNQHAFVAQRLLEYSLIATTSCDFSDRLDIVLRLTKRANDRRSAAFVREKVHALEFRWAGRVGKQHDFFMRNACGPIGDGGADVLGGEVRIVFE